MEVAPAVDNSGSAKRRKVGNGELRLSSSKSVRITSCDGEDVVNTLEKKALISGLCADEMSFCSGDTPASCCSSDGSIMLKMKCVDLEEKAEIEATVRGNSDRFESFRLQINTQILSPNFMAGNLITPASEFTAESTPKQPVKIDSRRTLPPEKTPPAAELEEFFASAEKNLQKRFKDKYNYDIVNDVPLKGRFEWIHLKQ